MLKGEKKRRNEAIKKLEWNKKTAVTSAVTAMLIIVLVVVLYPREITIAENTTLDPIVWTFKRPTDIHYVVIEKRFKILYSVERLSVTLSLAIADYIENTLIITYDQIRIVPEINATATNNAFVVSICVVCHPDSLSGIGWSPGFTTENLKLVRTSPSILLNNENQSGSIYFSTQGYWYLPTENSQSHQMELTYEILYHNGTAYNKVIQLFQLNILGGV